MSPILVRPVREQLEHDKVVRLLQAKYKRKYEVAVNPGNEQTTSVVSGSLPWYPDLVLQSPERGRRLLGVVEVETAESVNNLEAMSQWAAFARLRAPFHLYVPAVSVDTTKRLCAELQLTVAEIWAYHPLGDHLRFTLIQRVPRAADRKVAARARSRPRSARRAESAVRPARPRAAAGSGARAASAKAKKTRGAAPRRKPSRASRPHKRK